MWVVFHVCEESPRQCLVMLWAQEWWREGPSATKAEEPGFCAPTLCSALSVTRPPSFLPSEKPTPEQGPVVAQVFRVEDRRHVFKTAFCGPGLVTFRAVA